MYGYLGSEDRLNGDDTNVRMTYISFLTLVLIGFENSWFWWGGGIESTPPYFYLWKQ